MSVPAMLRAVRSRALATAFVASALVLTATAPAEASPSQTQTVTFTSTAPSPAHYGGTYQPSASASSGLAVTITVDGSSTGCTLGSGTVTFVGVGTCVLDANQAGDGTYLPASAQQSFAIDPAPLTASIAGTQTYGGASTIYLITGLSGLQLGDTSAVVTGSLSCTSSVTSSSPAGDYPIGSCSGLAAGSNYTLGYSLGNVTVHPAPLTVTASSATFTYGGAAPAISASYQGFVNGDTAASLTTAPSCSTTATSTSPTGSYGSSCSGAASPNYAISYSSGVVTVTRATLIITASSGSFNYGGTPPAVAASYSGFVNGDTPASLTTAPSCTSAATASSAVGTYSTSCSGAAAHNYTIAYQSGVMTVNKAPLTITASSGSFLYGDDVPAVSATYSGFVNGDTAFDLIDRPTCGTTATSSSPVDVYPTSCSGAVSSDYAIHYVNGTMTVGATTLTITASSATISYGSSSPSITPFYSGFINGDTPASLTKAPTCGTAVSAATPVGSYHSSCSGATAPNYAIVYVDGTVTVNKAPLTVTARDTSRPIGAANAFGYTLSGFVNGDGPSVVSGQPAFNTSANATSEPGMYLIEVSAGSLSAANYTFTFVNGWLTVLKGTPTLVAATVSQSASVRAGKMTFSATLTNSYSGAPVVGVSLAFKLVTQFGNVITCSGTTDTTGTASCSTSSGNILLLWVPRTYSVNFAGNFDYYAVAATGNITS